MPDRMCKTTALKYDVHKYDVLGMLLSLGRSKYNFQFRTLSQLKKSEQIVHFFGFVVLFFADNVIL